MKTIKILIVVIFLIGIIGCENNQTNPVGDDSKDVLNIQENNVNIFCDSKVLNEQLITNKRFDYVEDVGKVEIELDVEQTYTFERKGKRINYLHIESDKYLAFNSIIPKAVMTGKVFVMVNTYFLDFNIRNTDNDVATIKILIGFSNE